MNSMARSEFHRWFKEEADIWTNHGEKSISQFAVWLKMSQSTVDALINETRGIPKSQDIIDKLVSKFGPIVYDKLGRDRPVENPGLSIPLLGRIAAGTAIAMPQSDFPAFGSDSFINILRDWLPPNMDPSNLFALEVEGDSMLGEGIHDGDTIVICTILFPPLVNEPASRIATLTFSAIRLR